MELESIILSEVSHAQKSKNLMFYLISTSYVDFRSRANAVMLLNLGHMQEESTYQRNGDKQETQNLKVF
jgi:hypothetical protein